MKTPQGEDITKFFKKLTQTKVNEQSSLFQFQVYNFTNKEITKKKPQNKQSVNKWE